MAALKVVSNAGSYGIYSEFNARTPGFEMSQMTVPFLASIIAT